MAQQQKIYRGWRDRRTRDTHVTVDDHPLRHVGAHSETFEWGYSGSGPADLAWSILADYLGNESEEQAFRLHHQFKRFFIVRMDEWSWVLTAEQIEDWLKQPTR